MVDKITGGVFQGGDSDSATFASGACSSSGSLQFAGCLHQASQSLFTTDTRRPRNRVKQTNPQGLLGYIGSSKKQSISRNRLGVAPFFDGPYIKRVRNNTVLLGSLWEQN